MKVLRTLPSIRGISRGRLKAARHLFLPGLLLFSLAVLAPAAKAQAITIKNVGERIVNVCVFAGEFTQRVIPKTPCWNLRANESATWNRKDKGIFDIGLRESPPVLGSSFLCGREDVGAEVERIEVKLQPCTISLLAKQTIVRFCNDNANKLYVGFAYWAGKDKGWTSTGWRDVPARDCLDVTIWNYDGDIYYYAADDGDGRWTGDTTFCVHWTKGFQIANSDKSSCQGTGYRRVGMSKLAVKPGITTQRLVP